MDVSDDKASLDDSNVATRIKKLGKDKHEIYVYHFCRGTPEDTLIFGNNVHKIIKGKPCLTGASRFNVMDSLVEGEVQAT